MTRKQWGLYLHCFFKLTQFKGYIMSNKRKPVIGIAALVNQSPQDTAFKNYVRHFCGDAFVLKVREADGVPLIIPYINEFTESMVSDYISSVDSLLLTGGGDIDPTLYGEDKIPECGKTDILLDKFHIALVKEAIKQKKPVFGICRGCQLINIALHGTMHQDLGIHKEFRNHFNLETYERTSHKISIKDGTILKGMIPLESTDVNSLHHQAIKKVSPSLIVSAVSEDGVVEAVESKEGDSFILGVQWHPETMVKNKDQMEGLFKSFIEISQS